jgi:fatty-acyl-CoA synthase
MPYADETVTFRSDLLTGPAPTPTDPGQPMRKGDFATIVEALDYAALGATGLNLHSLRGELVEVLPYARLREQARAMAGGLLDLGLQAGDRVALAADTDGDFIRAFFACQYAGLTPAPVPLPAPFGGREAYIQHVRRMMQTAGARAAFAPANLGEWFHEAAEGLDMAASGAIASIPKVEGDLPGADADGLCYLQFSSGSTRFPLGVAVTQAALMANVVAIGQHGLAVQDGDRTTTWLPLYHDMGIVGMLLTSLGYQMSVDMMPTAAFVRRPLLWLDMITRLGGTMTYAPTFGYDLAARRAGSGSNDFNLSRLRVAGLGGDMIRPGPLRAFAKAFAANGFNPAAFVASYGMAEATLALSMTPPGPGLKTDIIDVDALERDAVARPATPESKRIREFALCGATLEAHQLEVRDSAGRLLADRQVGRVFARGPSLMRDYFNQPEETARVLCADGWLDTGDLGYTLDGEIVITGRAKDLIIVNGRNVWPQDLEWTAEHEIESLKSGDVAVFSIPAADQEQVYALVQARGRDPEVRAELTRQVAATLRAKHGLEVEVVLVGHNSLPQTSSGKLSRSKAKALYLEGAFDPVPA